MGYFHFKVSEVLPIQNLIENLIWSAISNQDNTRDITQYTMGLLLLHLMNLSNKIFLKIIMSRS